MSNGGEAETFSLVAWYVDPSDAPPLVKRKSRPHKKDFVGWGSRELIEFLKSIGRDTSQVISQYDVARIITSYVNDNGLISSAKKKRIVCDENLLSLFSKNSIGKNKIYDLLGKHYAENNEDLESDEDLLWGSDDNDGSAKHAAHFSKGKPQKKRRVMEQPKSCFAAIVSEKMKLIYLRKSLVHDLMKHLDAIEGTVVGSFVRTKSGPNDFLKKKILFSLVKLQQCKVCFESTNSYRSLLLKLGVKVSQKFAKADTQVVFLVARLIKDVPLPIFSDDNLAEEECEDLWRRVKEGLIKRPTVVGLEAKARVLHEDITKNWLARELTKLNALIDRANEKG